MGEICNKIKNLYANLMWKNLPIFKVPSNDLKYYETNERDAALSISKMPNRIHRSKSERVINNDSSDDDEEEKDLFGEFVMVDKDEADRIDRYLWKFNKPELLEEEAKRMDEGWSILMFTRKVREDDTAKHPTSLEDFTILKVIDKGSFGKVFLVKMKDSGKLYAMKWIWKDVLIEKKQIQNTWNEK